MSATNIKKVSDKSALTALLLCIFFGAFGIHRFYVGKVGTGILMFLTAGGFGIWTLIDLIMIACGDFTDVDNRYLAFSQDSYNNTPVKRVLLIIGSIFCSFLILILLIIIVAFYATSRIVDVARDQLSALRAENYEKAYTYTSVEFQKATNLDDFKNFVDHNEALKNNKDSTFTKREIENGVGVIIGTVQATNGVTTPIEYHLIKENGVWKILSIKTKPEESGAATEEVTNAASNDDENVAESKSTSNTSALTNVFENPNSYYSIKYPGNWEYTRPDKATVVFTGKKDTDAQYSSVNIQSILTKQNGGNHSDLKEFVSSIKKQAVQLAGDTKFISEKPITLDKTANRLQLKGRSLTFTYTIDEQKYQQTIYVFIRPDNQLFYFWAYTAPIERYETDKVIANEMLDSWSVY